MAPKSIAQASLYLQRCLEGIPVSCWNSFDGKRIHAILTELKLNGKDVQPSGGESYKIARSLAGGTEPTTEQFLAFVLHMAGPGVPKRLSDSTIMLLQRRNWAHLFSWTPSDLPNLSSSADDISWKEWFFAVWGSMFPSPQDLMALSPAAKVFRDAVMAFKVTSVSDLMISVDIPIKLNRSPQQLEELCTVVEEPMERQSAEKPAKQPSTTATTAATTAATTKRPANKTVQPTTVQQESMGGTAQTVPPTQVTQKDNRRDITVPKTPQGKRRKRSASAHSPRESSHADTACADRQARRQINSLYAIVRHLQQENAKQALEITALKENLNTAKAARNATDIEIERLAFRLERLELTEKPPGVDVFAPIEV
ncbi:uncharacterized protein DNG_08970 [Cephalotrichum gorgonifer]|uniref:Uncharacterized protein n=1 Tax=Cephalotrichum gorgonifer TaxID=2041049 RepID=A0AAE8N4L3_9PEZI|nr:uncharacterized protein DNG_08970 [Cephalotrichum gorgonifer]